MIWVKFIVFAAVIVVAAYFLAKYGDVIAVRTGLSGYVHWRPFAGRRYISA